MVVDGFAQPRENFDGGQDRFHNLPETAEEKSPTEIADTKPSVSLAAAEALRERSRNQKARVMIRGPSISVESLDERPSSSGNSRPKPIGGAAAAL
jgi:hypothetical protein